MSHSPASTRLECTKESHWEGRWNECQAEERGFDALGTGEPLKVLDLGALTEMELCFRKCFRFLFCENGLSEQPAALVDLTLTAPPCSVL